MEALAAIHRYAPDAPVTVLKGVGEHLAQRLAKLQILTLQDLLFHLPLRYEDRTRILPIARLQAGGAQACEGEIIDKRVVYGKKRMLLVNIEDSSGELLLRFFNFSKAQQDNLQAGKHLRCFGEVSFFQGQRQMLHPEYQYTEPMSQTAQEQPPSAASYTAVYPTTEGLGQHTLRKLVAQLFNPQGKLLVAVKDYLDQTKIDHQYPDLLSALSTCHLPGQQENIYTLNEGRHEAQLRLAFEELLAHRLSLQKLRAQRAQRGAKVLHCESELQQRFFQALGFALTAAQQRVIREIETDLAQPHPMQRLIQGDVGSGKTVVAAVAAMCALSQQSQVLIMAPTEILAEQHYRQFQDWFEPLQIPVLMLHGKLSAKLRRERQAIIEQQQAAIIIGTHALFQDQQSYQNVALVIVDEQHRFGVHQRLSLMKKAHASNGDQPDALPHQLIMTATPIPRTLTMTAYADLDCSVIDELPPGRLPVETAVIPDSRRDQVVARVNALCASGKQAYWVCTLIEESEVLQCQAAESCAEELQQALPDLTIGLIHGRMNTQEKSAVMAQFKSGDIDLLVATTVIEVGVDVANASLIVIENAERLGLSQLHQLRGRVGRSATQSHCLLLYKAPISQTARKRLAAIRDSNDGFEIAQKDLEIRGPGELLGSRQTGIFQLRIADLRKHKSLLKPVAELAPQLLLHKESSKSLIRRWIGNKQELAQV